jgi:hypothetical protein
VGIGIPYEVGGTDGVSGDVSLLKPAIEEALLVEMAGWRGDGSKLLPRGLAAHLALTTMRERMRFKVKRLIGSTWRDFDELDLAVRADLMRPLRPLMEDARDAMAKPTPSSEA